MSGTIYRSSVTCTLNWGLHLRSVASYKKIRRYLHCCSQPSRQEGQAACNAWGNTWTIKGRQRSPFLFFILCMCTVCCTGFLYSISGIAIWAFWKTAVAVKAIQGKIWKGLSALMQWFISVFIDESRTMPRSIFAAITCLRSWKHLTHTSRKPLGTRAA